MPNTATNLLPGINPPLPDALRPLVDLAYNFHWSFSDLAQSLFERIDRELWVSSDRNPVRVLADCSQERLATLADDEPFLRDLLAAAIELRSHLNNPASWFNAQSNALQPSSRAFLAAYFCAEFGIHESFQIYSGGLGLLAGDHLKSAAQLGLPLIGVGLLYRNGYFHQKLDAAGVQNELYPPLDPVRQPVKRVMSLDTGRQVTVSVQLPGRDVHCAVWRADIGSVRLYLLDTNIPENTAEDREITANLYLGDQNRRIQQELVLGIGGVRALSAIGEHPTVFHMNEGHAAFLALERIRQIRLRHAVNFDQAREAAAPAHLFTTHTPVPAGIDHFNINLVQHYFATFHDQLGLDMEGFMALGRQNVADKAEPFSMAVLALRCSKFCNGVSKLHGEVSRRMWRGIWPSTPLSDVPIGHVTNGVHTDTWVSPAMASLYTRHLGQSWKSSPHDPASWTGVDRLPDAELWAARCEARALFVRYCQQQSARNLTAGITPQLDPDALTIGFARRFAGYKRGTLLLHDKERFARILSGHATAGRPVQFIFAGKSHPGDGWGKDLIRDLVAFARSPMAQGRVVFLEDYAIDVAREMVRGCDVWLNTPIRGLEASGTSGMKAALNAVLHASVLDGWWDEGFQPDNGYKIADSGIYPSDAPNPQREKFEAEALYALIERELIPDFSQRGAANVPTAWTARMRRCLLTLAPFFSTHRMVAQYATDYYFPAHNAAARLTDHGRDITPARELADQIDRYRRLWSQTRVKDVDLHALDGALGVTAAVRLGMLRPDEVQVQVYSETGHPEASSNAEAGIATPMTAQTPLAGGDGTYQYTARVTFPRTVSPALCVRILPADHRLITPFIPGLITVSQPVQASLSDASV